MNSSRLQNTRLIYKNLLFLYTSNEVSERESKKKKIYLKLHPEKKKNPRNKLNQGGERPIH